ncbi:MAG: endolytic transglycosylase MltG [Candidatus Magasanikbacteria bacterium CG10_big_fil_rev_8_21_14_0_10_36_16]|uniref:Endolytic murein transglycosylase n=1 Tax=Candidatus Magasanikbacteria bacterium CG10_big_fil_rev_8_21_14_0_10_36_16 TaxID=1974645 RepID=A0A2H0U1H5_9BACT|nr:MAG: endolytic transglycosylase MltG [Candidatus Magasanikbacteria bacterium CG10_big_fil_rev_8_21_14_0_10_36_16]
MKKFIFLILLICIGIGAWFLYSEIFSAPAQYADKVTFEIEKGESVSLVAEKLEEKHIIRSAWFFKKYLSFRKLDTEIREGEFVVESPITLARVINSLANPTQAETTVTILPGWDLREIADYFEKQGIVSSTDFLAVVGQSAYNYKVEREIAPVVEGDWKIMADKPNFVSYDGYLAPDTYRIFKNATVTEIVQKLIDERENQFTDQMYADIAKSGHSVFEVLTMASILEREVRDSKDRKLVSDLFWRRYDQNWALQADSTVHYAVGKNGTVFTTAEDRDSLSPWNTYRYPGLPIGPISTPSLDSIMASIYPQSNEYWYFLTDKDGVVRYGKTLEEHNLNRQKYL